MIKLKSIREYQVSDSKTGSDKNNEIIETNVAKKTSFSNPLKDLPTNH